MKITRNQLRQLIQEEARSLSEDVSSAETPHFPDLDNKIAQNIIALADRILRKWKPGSAGDYELERHLEDMQKLMARRGEISDWELASRLFSHISIIY